MFFFHAKFNITLHMIIVDKRIVRATGYSSKRNVDFNPAIEDVVRALKSDGVDKSKK